MKNNLDGWTIETTSIVGESGLLVYALHAENKIEVEIPYNFLPVFGYVSNGPCLGITGHSSCGDIELQKTTLRKIIDDYLKRKELIINYHSIVDFLKKEYKVKNKIEGNSIKRTLDILLENYQELVRFRLSEFNKEKFKK